MENTTFLLLEVYNNLRKQTIGKKHITVFSSNTLTVCNCFCLFRIPVLITEGEDRKTIPALFSTSCQQDGRTEGEEKWMSIDNRCWEHTGCPPRWGFRCRQSQTQTCQGSQPITATNTPHMLAKTSSKSYCMKWVRKWIRKELTSASAEN